MVGRRILTTETVERILHRMALEVIERHYGESLPALLPASPRGHPIALRLQSLLSKEGYAIPIMESLPLTVPSVLLIDDVLYTGRTLLTRLMEIWRQASPHHIEVLVLIDRGHRRYPISPDYVGLRLATTLQEFVSVRRLSEGWEVWLE